MNIPTTPQLYDPAFDQPEKDEAETSEAITQQMIGIADKTFADGRHAIRSVHAKSHGLLLAELDVMANLPKQFAQGLFSAPGRYPAVMRFSTIPGDIIDDAVSTPRGVAIKIVGVDGERLESSEDAVTQDFVMVNGPQFSAPDGKAFLRSLKLVALTTDHAEGAKKALSSVMRNVEKVVEAFGGESGLAKSLGGEPPNNILGETFFAQLPLRYGDHIAKLQLVPVSPELLALTDKPVALGEDPNILRTAVIDHFRTHGGMWELRVQLCTNLDAMPIDDPTKVWDEERSPFTTVARLTAEPQTAWSSERSTAIDDGMGFSPWNGLAAHRPLGALMRMRRQAYAASQRFRSERNQTPVTEPTSLKHIL